MHAAPGLIPLDDYKAKARAGEPPAHVALRKQYIPDAVKSAGERKLTFTISTGTVDRDRDTVKVDGWRLDNWRKNPVILWAHNSRNLPIARGESILTGGGALKATAYFLEPGKDYNPATWPSTQPDPENVYRLLLAGALRATSVGFLPVKGLWNDERGGIDFEEQELLEFSIVPVPANPEALADAKACGVDLEPQRRWAESVLTEVAGPGLWLPKAAAERVLAQLETEPRLEPPSSPVPPAARQPVLRLRADEGRLPITAADVREATTLALKGLVRDAIRRHTGRLD